MDRWKILAISSLSFSLGMAYTMACSGGKATSDSGVVPMAYATPSGGAGVATDSEDTSATGGTCGGSVLYITHSMDEETSSGEITDYRTCRSLASLGDTCCPDGFYDAGWRQGQNGYLEQVCARDR